MANEPAKQSPGVLAKLPMGPRLIGAGAAVFVLTRIIKWLPLGWVDGPVLALLWIVIIGLVAAGAVVWSLQSKRK